MIQITSSLIKKFFRRGEPIAHCPYKIKNVFLDKKYEEEVSDSMIKGEFFESLCIGSTKDGRKVLDLPRKSLTQKQVEQNERMSQFDDYHPIIGEKTIDQVRIEELTTLFHHLSKKYMMTVEPFNVQTEVRYKYSDDFEIAGHIDIFPTPFKGQSGLFLAGVDLKLTMDVGSTFGDIAWGNYEHMDQTQGWMYNFLIMTYDDKYNEHLIDLISPSIAQKMRDDHLCKFFFWVFGYKPKSQPNKIIVPKFGKLEYVELKELIRKTVSLVSTYETDGWKTIPSYEVCKGCPVKCKDYQEFYSPI